MKKAIKVWEENKVLFVLAIILIICLIIFIIVSLTYFYGSSKSVYGTRLDITKSTPLKDTVLNNIKIDLESNSKVNSVNTIKKGKIVYVNIDYVDDVTMDEAKEIANSVVDNFSEEELNVYDIQIIISSKNTVDESKSYTLMGSRNANGSGSIVWNNYNIVEESAE